MCAQLRADEEACRLDKAEEGATIRNSALAAIEELEQALHHLGRRLAEIDSAPAPACSRCPRGAGEEDAHIIRAGGKNEPMRAKITLCPVQQL